jgi:hypothetical protein
MSNRIEDFIHSHRDEFDSEVPSSQVWNRVNEQCSGQSKNRVKVFHWIRWSAAAAILIVLGAGAWYWLNSYSKPTVEITESKDQSATAGDSLLLNEINPVYAREVFHFTQLIELKQVELKQLENENPELYHQFMNDINKLDSSYNRLKQELPANANREQLLEAMISNLQVQMDLLNQQLQIIQLIKQSKNKSNESNSKSI